MKREIKLERNYVEPDLEINDWKDIEGYFEELDSRSIDSVENLRNWFHNRSELEAIISENMAWRYINMTCDTANEEYTKSYQHFVQNIQPEIAPFSDKLNRKVIECPFVDELEKDEAYFILIREIRKAVEIFRKENIPLFTELQTLSQKFSQISGGMTVEHGGKEMTLQQAAVYLQATDRELREEIYHKIADRRLRDTQPLNEVFNSMIELRTRVAKNAGFQNFRDYMFKSMGRFDYTPEDCFNFHDSVESQVVPLLNPLAMERKEALGIDTLRPWDKAVDKEGRDPLKPFEGGRDLLEKSIECFHRIDPFLGDCLRTMDEMGHLDLESRTGKAPGGYNYPLYESGAPFIFMNATSTVRDMVTLMHEGGHAVHSFLVSDLELTDFKSTPSEVAELASMSMELISMDHWDLFFPNPDDLLRAKKEHLEQIIDTLPWVATIDKFQHWIYENHGHNTEDRTASWLDILDRFSDDVTQWDGLDENKSNLWQKQLHLFEVPFYYIEYGMAQLGAIAVWKKYREDKKAGLDGYINALKLGSTKTIPEVYEAAGIRFDFSKDYIAELIGFVRDELKGLR